MADQCCDVVVVTDVERVVVRDEAAPMVVVVDHVQQVTVRDTVTQTVVVTDVERIVVRDVGIQGPPGSGGGGSGERIEFNVEAGFDINAYRLVVPRLVEGSVRVADNSFIGHMDRPIWLTLTAMLDGEVGPVAGEGNVTNAGWSWVQGPIYLGEDGMMTQVPPEYPAAVFSAQVGYAVSPTSLYFSPITPIQLV